MKARQPQSLTALIMEAERHAVGPEGKRQQTSPHARRSSRAAQAVEARNRSQVPSLQCRVLKTRNGARTSSEFQVPGLGFRRPQLGNQEPRAKHRKRKKLGTATDTRRCCLTCVKNPLALRSDYHLVSLRIGADFRALLINRRSVLALTAFGELVRRARLSSTRARSSNSLGGPLCWKEKRICLTANKLRLFWT